MSQTAEPSSTNKQSEANKSSQVGISTSLKFTLLTMIFGKRSFVFSQILFLKMLALTYLVAYTSLYVQIPGLYGGDGILPAKRWLDIVEKTQGTNKVRILPTLLWYSKQALAYIPLPASLQSLDPTENFIHILCLVNIVLCVSVLVAGTRFLSFWTFLTLWISYLSVYQVGQKFLGFQWDGFLLEAGFLSIFYCPVEREGVLFSDEISIAIRELLKWLFFRFMFSSGVVKLTSNDATWWNLSTLDWHFQSQPIPNPVARYAHFLPKFLHKIGVVQTYIIEIFHPLMFYIPIPRLRHFLTVLQILFQTQIILTGNYNFFNLLTIAVAIPMFDDQALLLYTPRPLLWFLGISNYDVETLKKPRESPRLRLLWILVLTIITIICPLLIYFPMGFIAKGKINFNLEYLKEKIVNSAYLTYCVYMVGIMYIVEYLRHTIAESPTGRKPIKKAVSILKFTFAAFFAGYIFLATLFSFYNSIGARLENTRIDTGLCKSCYDSSKQFRITSGYGVFRSMTGIGGRPEIIIEGSMDANTWKEYEFFYKPGNVSRKCPWVAPHQPRVDWQMWFAALSDINHGQEWLVNMMARIFSNSSSVLSLIEKNPFPDGPPSYLRIRQYKYFYEPLNSTNGNWWRRVLQKDETNKEKFYLPAIRGEDMKQVLEEIKFEKVQLSKYPINPMQDIPIIHIIVTLLIVNVIKTRQQLNKFEQTGLRQ